MVLAAISELPLTIRPVVLLRVTRNIPDDEIARELGVTAEEIQRRLAQAQAILQRSFGPDFRLVYMRPEEAARPPAVPSAPTPAEPSTEAVAAALAGAPPEPSLADLVAASLSRLSAPLQGPGGAPAPGQETIREALHEAAELFRLAAERLSGVPGEPHPLRRMLLDTPMGHIRLIARGVADQAGYLAALDSLDAVEWVRVESAQEDVVTYSIQSASSSAVVRGLLGMEERFRPRSLRVQGDNVEITLPAGAPVPARVGVTQGAGPVFELGADAFFGARHFVRMHGVQGPPHHHSYRVEALMESSSQDQDGVVMGFAEARGLIERIVADYNETLLNTVPPFTETQPTCENVARVIYRRIAERLAGGPVRLKLVRVWESPTSHASYSDAAVAVQS